MITVNCDICGNVIANPIEQIDVIFENPCLKHISERKNLCTTCSQKVKNFIKTKGENR